MLTQMADSLITRTPTCAPDCPLCGGAGFVSYNEPPRDSPKWQIWWDKYRYGKHPCPNSTQVFHYDHSGLRPEDEGLMWEFILGEQAQKAVRAVRAALARGYGWVYLWGACGTAKTMVLKTAIAASLRDMKPAAYVRMVDLINDLRASYATDNPISDQITRLATWEAIPVLALDEFDRLRDTDYAREARFTIIDRRYEDAVHKHASVTIFASNSNPNDLDDYLRSRIFDNRFAVIQLKGQDARAFAEW